MKTNKLRRALLSSLSVISSVPLSLHAAEFDVLGGTFTMGGAPAQIVGDGTAPAQPGYPSVGRMITDAYTADYACADYDVTDVKAAQCETATDGTPGSPTASGPDDATASRNGLTPFNFFGSPTFNYFAATGVDFPSTPHPQPSIDLNAGTADMSSFYANWNGTEFHQGSIDPNNPKGGATSEATVTENPNGSYTISWASLIVGGPFNGVTGFWTLDVCPVPCELIPPAKAPSLEAEQGASGVTTRTVIQGMGDTVVSLNSEYDTTDITFSWISTDNALDGNISSFGPTLTIPETRINAAEPGMHRVVLVITDNSYDPVRKAAASLWLNILASDPGVDYADSDNDGIPNHADTILDTSQLQTDETTDTAWLMTVSNGVLKVGETSFCAERKAAGVEVDDITNFGGSKCTSTENSIDTVGVAAQTGLGDIFDFEVHGLDIGEQVEVVIPLKEPIRTNASYRKYTSVLGWRAFDQSEGDSYQSTLQTAEGVCPAHDAAGWEDGLIIGNDCLKLLITDGGPNDADNGADGVLKDPGTMASNPDIDSTAVDLGSLSWSALIGLFAWFGLKRRKHHNS